MGKKINHSRFLRNRALNLFHSLLLFSHVSLSQQKEGSNWIFGKGARVDFNTGTAVSDTSSNQNAPIGCGSISDSKGQLLFYTNGCKVWNRKNQVMPNGLGLLEIDSNKAVLIQKKPGSENLYYIFVANNPVPGNLTTGGLYYTMVDMNLENGLGDVLPMMKNIQLFSRVARMLAAAQHENNRDFWIITHGYPTAADIPQVILPGEYDSTFYSFKLTSSGIESSPVISFVGGSLERFLPNNRNGWLRTSPDSRLLSYSIEYNSGQAIIPKFDRLTGIVSKFVYVTGFGGGKGCFSTDSKFFFNCSSGGQIYSYDVTAGNRVQIQNTQQLVVIEQYGLSPIDSRKRITDVQLGLDGKIYVNPYPGATFLSRINNPCKRFGPDIGFEKVAVDLKGRKCGLEFPVHNQTLFVNAGKLQAQAAKDTICIGDSVEIMAYGAGAETFQWFKGQEITVFSTANRFKVAPSATTNYKVKGSGTCAGSKDTSVTVVVLPRPSLELGQDKKACGKKAFTLSHTNTDNLKYKWYSDLGSGNFTTSGYLTVQVTERDSAYSGFIKLDLSNAGCTVSDSIKVSVFPTPKARPVLSPNPDTTICKGQTAIFQSVPNPQYKTIWSTGDSSTSLSVTEAGVYTARFKSVEGCLSDSASLVLLIVNPLPITQTQANNKKDTTLCFPANINLGIQAQQNITYTWQGPTDSLSNSQVSNPVFTFLNQDTVIKAVNYQLSTVNSLSGCTNKDSLKINLLPNLRPFAGPDKSFCNESQTTIGQKGYLNFSYNWLPTNGLTSSQSANTTTNISNPSFENILSQTYIRTVSLLGCNGTDSVEVRVFPQVPKPQLAGPQFVCPGVRNVPYQFTTLPASNNITLLTFHISATGGDSSGNLTINWNQENPNAGIAIKLSNIYGCNPDSVFLPVNITQYLRPQTKITPGINDSLCLASALNVPYKIEPFNGQSSYSWTFEPNSVSSQSASNGLLLSGFTLPGRYTLTLTESDTTALAQCFGKTVYNLRIWPHPEGKVILGKDSLCEGNKEAFTLDNVQVNSRLNWRVERGKIDTLNAQSSNIIYTAAFGLKETFESVALMNIETSEKGCQGPENQKILMVESLPKPVITSKEGPIRWNALFQEFEALGRPASRFLWDSENGELISSQGLSKASVSWWADQLSYGLQVKEITHLGCEGLSEKLFPDVDKALFIPNLITANGDGKNDFLKIENLHFYPNHELEIYNRWGKRVYKASPYSNNWPIEQVQEGLYFFHLKVAGTLKNGSGYLEVLR